MSKKIALCTFAQAVCFATGVGVMATSDSAALAAVGFLDAIVGAAGLIIIAIFNAVEAK